jgi:hypothetical protein
MSNRTNEKIQNSVWDTDWAQDDGASKASYFYEPENAWIHAHLPNDEVATVNVFAFEPIDLRVRLLLNTAYMCTWTKLLLAPRTREAICLHLALCEFSIFRPNIETGD